MSAPPSNSNNLGGNTQQPPTAYTTSFQQLMAQRYPQLGTNPNNPTAPMVNNPLAPNPGMPSYPPPGGMLQQQQQQQQQHKRNDFAPPPGSSLQQPQPLGQGVPPPPSVMPTSGIPGVNHHKPPSTTGGGGAPVSTLTAAANAKAALQKLSTAMNPHHYKEAAAVKAAVAASKSGKKSTSNRSGGGGGSAGGGASSGSGITFNTPQQNQWLAQCDYRDKTIWATRLLMGGNSVNGFLRSTATVQRIKKQRARQNNSTKQSRAVAAAQAAATAAGNDPAAAAASATASVDKKAGAAAAAAASGGAFDQAEEEQLKMEIMNPRTAKKLKSEFEQGLVFCATVCNVLRGVLFDMDKSLASSLPPALIIEQPKKPAKFTFLIPSDPVAAARHVALLKKQQGTPTVATAQGPSAIARASFKANTSGIPSAAGRSSVAAKKPDTSTPAAVAPSTASPGGSESSTLRKLRKKKNTHMMNGPPVDLPEVDASGKRLCTKKEHNYRVFQLLRFRPLRQGDFCAARLSSRDLWILAKVVQDYPTGPTTPPHNLQPLEFLQLTDAKRAALFRNKVPLKDVEEGEDAGTTPVARNLVLPLPRNFAEASEWATRLKKGSRVYAMYPQTTSLYPATVVDSTTYCRLDDDIVVVEFDGEEVDPLTGKAPSYHIPARFVTLIPRELPASQNPKSSSSGSSQAGAKRKSVSSASGGGGSANKKRSSTGGNSADDLDMLAMDFDAVAGGAGLGFDALDLDFDKPLDDGKQQEEFPPF